MHVRVKLYESTVQSIHPATRTSAYRHNGQISTDQEIEPASSDYWQCPWSVYCLPDA